MKTKMESQCLINTVLIMSYRQEGLILKLDTKRQDTYNEQTSEPGSSRSTACELLGCWKTVKIIQILNFKPG